MAVSALVLEAGGDEDLAIAAVLDDAVEDQGGPPTLQTIRRIFGIGLRMSLWSAPTRIANRSRRGASGKSNTWPTFLVHPQMRFSSQSLTNLTQRGQF